MFRNGRVLMRVQKMTFESTRFLTFLIITKIPVIFIKITVNQFSKGASSFMNNGISCSKLVISERKIIILVFLPPNRYIFDQKRGIFERK